MSDEPTIDIAGERKSAILLMTLEEDATAEVFKFFTHKEIEELSHQMANLGQVSHREMECVLDGFYDQSEEFSMLGQGSDEYIRTVLNKVLGTERADSLLENIVESNNASSGIDSLNMVEAATVSEMIRDEHPQIIATILVHLARVQAADILERFDDKLRNDVVLRIATFTGVQPAALHDLTEVLSEMLEGHQLKRSKMGGIKTAAEVLNLMNTSSEETIMTTVREYSEDLAQKIVDEMFLFENLVDLEDKTIQVILKEIDTDSLAVALKGAPEPLMVAFTRNMSNRAADMFKDNMENRGRVRVSQVEEEQKSILLIIRKLADTGEIVLSSGEEDYV